MQFKLSGIAVMLIVAAGLAACAPHQYVATTLEPPKELADFTVQQADGGSFTLSELGDKVLVLYFGYTSCPDVCPATLYTLHRAMDALGDDAAHYQVAMLTVDPVRDTPDRLDTYMKNIDPSFVGLYEPDTDKLAAIMQDFGVFAEQDPTTQENSGYTVTHSSHVFVIDKSGMRLLFSYDTPADQIADDLRAFLKDQ